MLDLTPFYKEQRCKMTNSKKVTLTGTEARGAQDQTAITAATTTTTATATTTATIAAAAAAAVMINISQNKTKN
eukprot:14568055-Ditylum_brightwellii.AAC.1